jgi:rhodanese-related sulfurtransferase
MHRKIFLGLAAAMAFCFVSTGAGWAGKFPVITAKALKAKMDGGEKVFLLNPLSDIEFNEQHVPGSVNIPLNEIKTTDKLPKNKNTLIVTYCLGPK